MEDWKKMCTDILEHEGKELGLEGEELVHFVEEQLDMRLA